MPNCFFPERPCQVEGTDIFYSQSVDYLLVVHYFSRCVEVAALKKNKTASEIIRALKAIFARNGIPEKVRSDNGPPYDSQEYNHFAREWGFQIAPSSPRYAQSNGEAEGAVQTIKNILKKEKDKEIALLAYRSTPLSNGYSSAELLMGRRLRNTVPMFQSHLTPDWPDYELLNNHKTCSKIKQQEYYNSRRRAQPLPHITSGTEVQVTTDKKPGVILKETEAPRQYIVQTPSAVIRKNRRHLVPLATQTPIHSSEASSSSTPVTTVKREMFASPKLPEINITSRPKRLLKPSLKALESMSNSRTLRV